MLAEERLELTVEAPQLGNGETVSVLTKMGAQVASGIVSGVYKSGENFSVQVREFSSAGSSVDRLYSSQLYSFVADSPEEETEDEYAPSDGEPLTDNPSVDPISEVEDSGDEKSDKKPKDDEVRANTDSVSSKVDVDALPDEIKKRVVGVTGLDEEQRNRILSEISDAALRAMKIVGVKDSEIYNKVVSIQNAVAPLLGKGG